MAFPDISFGITIGLKLQFQENKSKNNKLSFPI